MLIQAEIKKYLEEYAPSRYCLGQVVAGNGVVGSVTESMRFNKEPWLARGHAQ